MFSIQFLNYVFKVGVNGPIAVVLGTFIWELVGQGRDGMITVVFLSPVLSVCCTHHMLPIVENCWSVTGTCLFLLHDS